MSRNTVIASLMGVLGATSAATRIAAEIPEICPCGCGMKLVSCTMAKCKAKQQLIRANKEAWTTKIAENNRKHIKETVRDYMSGSKRGVTITSEYRENSEAHKRGAIDISSKNLPPAQRHSDAKGISARLGKGYTVVVEELGPDGRQTNTSYREGKRLNVQSDLPPKASATHTHIQPDRLAEE